MALLKGKVSEIPPEAVRLTRDEAIKHQLMVMNDWKPKSDTFAFRYGGTFLGSASALVGVYINTYYRRKFKLRHYGHFSSFLPSAFLPAAVSFLCHTQFVTFQVTLPDICAICLQMRASAIQTMAGCVLPTILAPLAAIPLAMQYHTYDVPYITKEPMKVVRLLQRQTKPVANTLMGIFIAQALFASIVTYLEAKSVYTVSGKLAKMEYELHEQLE